MIGSVKKACQIISCFTNRDPALGIGEIANRLNMNVYTLYCQHALQRGGINEGQQKTVPPWMEIA
ncbi:IclR family transcriptional regulator [Bacillus freudenreichii]|nr:IclR family transcriptional regulator [Bacillus freudenreichii]